MIRGHILAMLLLSPNNCTQIDVLEKSKFGGRRVLRERGECNAEEGWCTQCCLDVFDKYLRCSSPVGEMLGPR